MEKRDRIEFEGEVVDASHGKFLVRVNENLSVLCTISGKIRTNCVKILIGDIVRIEVSEYDANNGRIVYRKKS